MKKITFPESEDVMVTVDSVTYQPLAQTPEDRPYCFVYVISIWNHSEYPITVVARKWVVSWTWTLRGSERWRRFWMRG